MNIQQALNEHTAKLSEQSKKIAMLNDLIIDLEHIRKLGSQILNLPESPKEKTPEMLLACSILKSHCNRALEGLNAIKPLIPEFDEPKQVEDN